MKRTAIALLVVSFLSSFLTGCKQSNGLSKQSGQSSQTGTPKYIFLFIGDGMSNAQVQATALYLGSQKSGITTQHLSFMDFPTIGSMETYDALSYIPDSASAGTAMATGKSTESSKLGMDTEGKAKYKTIAERLKAEKGYKIGIISTV